MAKQPNRQTSAKPVQIIEKGIRAGYQPKPADKPISEGYQPKPTPTNDIVTPPPPKNGNEKK